MIMRPAASTPVFTVEEREHVRESLVAAARSDERIVGAAHTGSFALGRADRWSDIDLALSVASGAGMDDVVADWTRRLYDRHGAATHHDIWYGATRFRVFLLADTLQVDLAFWHDGAFGAIGPAFRLIFGSPAPEPPPPAVTALDAGEPTRAFAVLIELLLREVTLMDADLARRLTPILMALAEA